MGGYSIWGTENSTYSLPYGVDVKLHFIVHVAVTFPSIPIDMIPISASINLSNNTAIPSELNQNHNIDIAVGYVGKCKWAEMMDILSYDPIN